MRRYICILAAFALLFAVSTAFAIHPAIEVVSSPDRSTPLDIGEKISYEFRFLTDKRDSGPYPVRASLSPGLTLDIDSVVFTAVAPAEASPKVDVVLGNDGFVLIVDSIAKDDLLTFTATANGTQSALKCAVSFDEEEYTQEHSCSIPAAAAPRQQDTTASCAVHGGAHAASWIWITAGAVLVCALIATAFLIIRSIRRKRAVGIQHSELTACEAQKDDTRE
ncbi:MAG: hypothetical protein RR232_00345 [Clostridia bacterium]